MKKFLSDEQHDRLREAVAGNGNDLALIIAGKPTVVADALANLRVRIAREENLIPADRWDFLWVVDFPLFEYDDESQRYFARHHPFTSPAGDAAATLADPGRALARAYDVVLNGLELGGGSIRINRPEIQQKMFDALGISAEEARERFGFLLDAFRYGAPPHGGIALGFDRIIMMMAREDSIRSVIAFPKTTAAQDLMTDAPSTVDDAQLADLAIQLRKGEKPGS
jgi:aspartyl-tRNA synthetase